VEDSPNSAGETIDAIRCLRLARQRGLAGPLVGVSAYTMKHPPVQFADYEALRLLEAFIAGDGHVPLPGVTAPPRRPPPHR
jgi:myo-inositol-1-phosphate synthase